MYRISVNDSRTETNGYLDSSSKDSRPMQGSYSRYEGTASIELIFDRSDPEWSNILSKLRGSLRSGNPISLGLLQGMIGYGSPTQFLVNSVNATFPDQDTAKLTAELTAIEIMADGE